MPPYDSKCTPEKNKTNYKKKKIPLCSFLATL